MILYSFVIIVNPTNKMNLFSRDWYFGNKFFEPHCLPNTIKTRGVGGGLDSGLGGLRHLEISKICPECFQPLWESGGSSSAFRKLRPTFICYDLPGLSNMCPNAGKLK